MVMFLAHLLCFIVSVCAVSALTQCFCQWQQELCSHDVFTIAAPRWSTYWERPVLDVFWLTLSVNWKPGPFISCHQKPLYLTGRESRERTTAGYTDCGINIRSRFYFISHSVWVRIENFTWTETFWNVPIILLYWFCAVVPLCLTW